MQLANQKDHVLNSQESLKRHNNAHDAHQPYLLDLLSDCFLLLELFSHLINDFLGRGCRLCRLQSLLEGCHLYRRRGNVNECGGSSLLHWAA